MTDDTGLTGFFVGLDRAAVEAFGVGAVMASSGDGLLPTRFIFAAEEESDITPRFIFVEAVLAMASGDAGFARAAFVEGDFESVLFARTRFGERDEVAVMTGKFRLKIMLFSKIGHRSIKFLLVGEESVDESLFWSEAGHV